MSEAEDLIIVEVSDYLDGALKGPEKDAIASKIAGDPEYKRVHDEMVETRNALSGLQKRHAPSTFAADVTSTIHKRSAGRFFARRTFGDRVPFSALLVIAVLGLCAIAYLLWASETGSLKPAPERTPIDPAITAPVPVKTP
jgi:anti-sigma factor RsiW